MPLDKMKNYFKRNIIINKIYSEEKIELSLIIINQKRY